MPFSPDNELICSRHRLHRLWGVCIFADQLHGFLLERHPGFRPGINKCRWGDCFNTSVCHTGLPDEMGRGCNIASFVKFYRTSGQLVARHGARIHQHYSSAFSFWDLQYNSWRWVQASIFCSARWVVPRAIGSMVASAQFYFYNGLGGEEPKIRKPEIEVKC